MIQQYSERFSQAVLTPETVSLLHTEGIIAETTASEIDKCGGLIGGHQLIALRVAVAEDHNKLKLLISILKKTNEAILLANEIAQEYGEYIMLCDSAYNV